MQANKLNMFLIKMFHLKVTQKLILISETVGNHLNSINGKNQNNMAVDKFVANFELSKLSGISPLR